MDQQKMMNVFRLLCLEAGDIIMKIYESNNFGIDLKSDNSPVTLADRAADEHISNGIRNEFGDIQLITEEQTLTHCKASDSFIIVDPLDGTKEFINRNGDFTINIAYVENGVPILGVVYAPAKKRLFYTDIKGGSVEEEPPYNFLKPGKVRKLNLRVPDNNKLTMVASKSHRNNDTNKYISQYKVSKLKGAGSSLKFCLLAAGEADIYPRLGRTMEWDTAAGHAVLRNAGGHVVKFEDHQPLIYGKPSYENPFFIAYIPGVKLKGSK